MTTKTSRKTTAAKAATPQRKAVRSSPAAATGLGTVLISGGAKGLGRGMALALAKDGWNVAICDIDAAALERTVRDVARLGRCKGWLADIAVKADVDRWVDEAEATLGPITALVNNAIAVAEGFFLELSEEGWRRTIDITLTGYFLCAQAAARRMVTRRYGRIINHSSGAAERGIPRTVSYACAKGGVNSLTRTMAVELAQYGIAVNTLTTGPMMTETFAGLAKTDEGLVARRRRVPMGRFGEIDDIMPLVRYLISPGAAWTTGGLFHVDGGANNAALVQSVQQ